MEDFKNISIIDNKYNMKDVFEILNFNYENHFNLASNYFYIDDIVYFSKEELIEFLEELLEEEFEDESVLDKDDFDLIKKYKNYLIEENILNVNNIEEFLTIDKFILKNNYNIFENDIFYELWEQLYNKKEILITENLLNFLYKFDKNNLINLNNYNKIDAATKRSHVIKKQKQTFLKFLQDNLIEYEQIDYKSNKINNYVYILKDIQISNSHTIHSKRWIILTIDNFKEVAMIKSPMVRKYYLTLEKILFDYYEYTSQYNLNKKEKEIEQLSNSFQTQLTLKETQIINTLKEKEEQEKKAKESEKLKEAYQDFFKRKQDKEMNEIIYLITKDSDLIQNIFKLGKTQKDILHSRLKTYNTGESELHYYVFYKLVFNAKFIEEFFKINYSEFLIKIEDKSFNRTKFSHEMYKFYFDDFEYILNLLIQSDNDLGKITNEKKNQFFENSYKLISLVNPIILREENIITTRTYANNELISSQVIIFENLTKEEQKDLLEKSFVTFSFQEKNKRKNFEKHLEDNYNIKINKKKNTFEIIKDYFQTKNLKLVF